MLTLPNYNIKIKVFDGLSCTLYRGERIDGKRSVLIKVPSKGRTGEYKKARLLHEKGLAESLDSDHLLIPLEIVEAQSDNALVYEDFGGVPLSALVSRIQESPARALEIGLMIARTLQVLHQSSISHKNLNAEVVLYNPETNQLKIGGLHWAGLLTRQNPTAVSVHSLQGMAEYIAPEQTGRLTRVADFRVDFYSLGVILYQLLTGRLPFTHKDPAELIYAHCVKDPEEPRFLDENISSEMSQVVMKALAKEADKRYQSAEAMIADLEICLEGLQTGNWPQDFEPGRFDSRPLFRPSQRFIGRENALSIITEVLTRVTSGNSSFHLIGGDSGVGKRDLLREAQRHSLKSNGMFAVDGFSELSNGVPYSAIGNAFRQLMLQVSGDRQTRLSEWRKEIITAVGSRGHVLVPIIPEISELISDLPLPLGLPDEEEALRLERVFYDFLAAIARMARPLVLFLNELQWADPASLRLMESILRRGGPPYFAFIGTCQDADVPAGHPLENILEKLKENALDLGYIYLRPFNRREMSLFVADSLNMDEKSVTPLAQIIFEKTGGNPFFVRQFITLLHQKELLVYDESNMLWTWDREAITALEMTENLGRFLAEKLSSLEEPARQILHLASVIGPEFSLRSLAETSDQRLDGVAALLWPGVSAGLVTPIGDSYRIFIPGRERTPEVTVSLDGTERFRFAHGHVRSAAYNQLPADQRAEIHLAIGRRLQRLAGTGNHKQQFLDMVNHLNLGRSKLQSQAERTSLAQLNLQAAVQSREATAYQAAAAYCRQGLENLEKEDPQDPLWLRLQVLNAESEYLNADFDEAERIIRMLTERAPEGLELARAYDLKVVLCTIRGRNLEGIDAGYQALRLLGIRFPKGEELVTAATRQELARFEEIWSGQSIAELVNIPEMTSPDKKLAVKVLTSLVPLWNQSFQSENKRIMLLAMRGINLSVEFGNSPYSAVCYSLYGMFSLDWHQNARIGLELGKLGMVLAEKFGSGLATCRTNNIFGAFINHWSSHARTSLDYLEKGFRAGKDYGEPVFAVYALIHKLVIRVFTESRLISAYRASQGYLEFVSRTGYREFQDFLLSYQWMLNQLMGHEDNFFQYDAFVERLRGYQDRIPLCVHYLNETKTAFFLEDYERAWRMSRETSEHIGFLSGSLLMAEHVFFKAMTLVALYHSAPIEDQRNFLRKIEECHRKLTFWSNSCPENFLHLELLVEAEWMAIHERHLQAMQLFDGAIDAAHAQGFHQYGALANEWAAKFYLEKGRRRIATVYMTDAYNEYNQWGAGAKCRQLQHRYREFIRLEFTNESRDPKTPGGRFYSGQKDPGDFLSLMRTTSMLPGSGQTNEALENIMVNALETTGAQCGHLILKRDQRWLVKVEGWSDERGVAVIKGLPVDDCTNLSPAIIAYMDDHNEPVLLDNACREGLFRRDPHILENRVKSILAVPAQGRMDLMAILYMQNAQIAGAFTNEHVQALQVILRRVISSLENPSD